ncbi:protein obstructor-E-like [Haliotis cracherodii]|uniref:protein obstructor-E-like n=1 Tax=Haliotis cracherodii TaxID=6455 RepID=UPI0039EA433A
MGVSFTLVVLSGLLGFSLAFNCPESDGHFQHETRCDMYYWCVAAVPHVSHCPPGSFFSTITNFCNWPYAVSGCSDDGARTDVGGGGWSQPQPQPQPPQQQPRQPPQHLNSWEQDNHRWNDQGWDSYMAKALTGALSKVKTSGRQKREAAMKAVAYQGFDICGGDDGYFRHADDCTMYWWCINGIPRIQMCQGGLFFDPVIRRCSWAKSVSDCSFDGKRTLPYKSKSMQ